MEIYKVVLLVSPLNKIGGKASFTKTLIEFYRRNKIKYYHIDLIRAKSENPVLRLFQHAISFIYYKLKFVYLTLSKKIDIVQIHTSSHYDFFDLSIFVLLSKLFGKYTIVRYGGSVLPERYNSYNRLIKKYIKFTIRSYDRLVVQSSYWRDSFIQLGMDSSKIHIVPNFVDTGKYVLNEAKYNNEKFHVLFMPADNLHGKGFHDVKDAIIEIAGTNKNVVFHMVGPEIYKFMNGENIKVYDKLYGSAKMDLFNKCTIFLLPTHNEGFSNAILEAMASGMAVITTKIPAMESVITDGVDGMLIDVGSTMQFKEKIQHLLENPHVVKKLGRSAQQCVEHKYAYKNMGNYLKVLYNGNIEE
jgi:glycosyltransferase involved in cell wall biosynthesis